MKENYYALIMAGGIGSRFWPVSTTAQPKQFQDMLGKGNSLIAQTADRLGQLIPEDQIWVATNERYETQVLSHIKGMQKEQVVLEPCMRNTAPCILYSALKIYKQNQDGVMVVAPSDHVIEDEKAFKMQLKTAFEASSKDDVLMTLGIRPSGPNTGYGYIRFKESSNATKPVVSFTEKPDLPTAREFVASGEYLWNAGIFVWSVKSILKAFEEYLPEMYELFANDMGVYNTSGEKNFIQENYGKAENVSIDYGIMEKANNVLVLPSEFGWNDLGTWGSLYQKLDKDEDSNAKVNTRLLALDSSGNMIFSASEKKVILKGLNDYIVVETDEALLVVPKSDEQAIKQIAAEAKKI